MPWATHHGRNLANRFRNCPFIPSRCRVKAKTSKVTCVAAQCIQEHADTRLTSLPLRKYARSASLEALATLEKVFRQKASLEKVFLQKASLEKLRDCLQALASLPGTLKHW